MIDEDKENFCDLVTTYSEDAGSIATCGEYAVAQNGQFVPEFEEAAFDMELDEVRVVTTTFGDHIMWKVEELEENIEVFDDVKEEIKLFLAQQQSTQEVPAYIASLRDKATIEIYSLEEEVATPEATTPAPIEVEVEAQEEREVVVEKTKPARTDDFGECLADLDATMYGVDWAPDVAEQKDILGKAFEQVTYLDCDVEDCGEYNVYPTWTFNLDGESLVLKGKQSLNSLERETGCTSA
jgi:sulfur carrier protein ThiS